MRIALLGTRGIPANYGGFETFAEELSVRLVGLGHHVTVYARHRLGTRRPSKFSYKGVEVLSAPTVMHKYLETPLHALFSFFDLFFRKVDLVLLCNAANSPFAFLVRLRGVPLLINVDGIERKRSKWNALGRVWYRLGEICSVIFATRVIADAKVIANYYQDTYGERCEVIAYGATQERVAPGELITRLGLEPNRYILYVARLEPENNCLGVIQAFNKSGVDIPLVIVGDAPYADSYKAELRAIAIDRVVFAGFQFGAAYRELRTNCAFYIQAGEVGGTHPALLEGMAYGNCILANKVPEHEEVLSDCGLYYRFNDFDHLSALIGQVHADSELRAKLGEKAQKRAKEMYDWELITKQYELLMRRAVER